MTISSAAPARISFVTGGDKDHYLEKMGWGNALNAAISLRSVCSVAKKPCEPPSRMAGLLLEHYGKEHGLGGACLSVRSDIPREAGLGGSAAHCVSIIRALDKASGVSRSPEETARLAYEVERKWMGIDGGYQDQFASAYGGINYMKFSGNPCRPDVSVRRVAIGRGTLKKLEGMTLLVHIPRAVGGDAIHKSMRQNTESMVHFMKIKRELCELAAEELESGDLEGFFRTVDLEYQLKRKQSPLTVDGRMEAIRKAAMDAGAVGMKFMGAGGGGCAIIFCRDKAAMAERLKGKARVLDFRFEV